MFPIAEDIIENFDTSVHNQFLYNIYLAFHLENISDIRNYQHRMGKESVVTKQFQFCADSLILRLIILHWNNMIFRSSMFFWQMYLFLFYPTLTYVILISFQILYRSLCMFWAFFDVIKLQIIQFRFSRSSTIS